LKSSSGAAASRRLKKTDSSGEDVLLQGGPSLEAGDVEESPDANPDDLRLALPEFDETPLENQETILMDFFTRCNWRCSAEACCLRHGALESLEVVSKAMLRHKCTNKRILVSQPVQCVDCGALSRGAPCAICFGLPLRAQRVIDL
jgi:hypothetical protein